jgi:hypothetical protein
MSTKRIVNENSVYLGIDANTSSNENGVYWEIDANTSKRLSDKENSAGSEIMSEFKVDEHQQTVVTYIGSATNVIPVHQYPEHDFVFVTPEPSHSVAVAHWPEGCIGWWQLMQSREQLLDIIHACLGRSIWSMKLMDETLAVFTHILPTQPSTNGVVRHQTLRVFTGMSSDDMDDRVRAEVLAADHYILGFDGKKAEKARTNLFDCHGSTATELLDPSDNSSRGGEFEPLQGSPDGIGQEWTWVPYSLDNEGNWLPTASDTIMREHPGPIVY